MYHWHMVTKSMVGAKLWCQSEHERAGIIGHGCNESSRTGGEAGGLGIEVTPTGGSGVGEECPILKHIAQAPPVPLLPAINVAAFVVYALRHLLGTARHEVIALTVDGGIFTASDGVHLPAAVVVVHHMEVPISTPSQSKTPTHDQKTNSSIDHLGPNSKVQKTFQVAAIDTFKNTLVSPKSMRENESEE